MGYRKFSVADSIKTIVWDFYFAFLAFLLRTNFCERLKGLSVRCMQPGQQQGRRIPSLSSETTRLTCSFRVSSFLTEIVQQIHSFRAKGVMSSQRASAFASPASAFRKSGGSGCATPPEILAAIPAHCNKSTFAAMMKSFSERPPIACVVKCTLTLPQLTASSG